MSDEFWLIAGMTAVTFGVRYPLLALVGRTRLPDGVARALGYVPVAVLTAIVVPAALMPAGELALGWRNPYLVAAVVAGAVAWRGRSLLLTIVVGLLVFALWRQWPAA